MKIVGYQATGMNPSPLRFLAQRPDTGRERTDRTKMRSVWPGQEA